MVNPEVLDKQYSKESKLQSEDLMDMNVETIDGSQGWQRPI